MRADEPPAENRNPMRRTLLVKLRGTYVRPWPHESDDHSSDGRPQKKKVRVDFPSLGPRYVRFTSCADLMHWWQGHPCVRNLML